MLPIPMTIPLDWQPLPSFMLESVATRKGTTRRFTPALEKAIQAGRVEIDSRKATRKTHGIYWRKARPSLFQ